MKKCSEKRYFLVALKFLNRFLKSALLCYIRLAQKCKKYIIENTEK